MDWIFQLDWAQVTVTSLLTLVLITIGNHLIGPYLKPYLKKKGENRATIEDLEIINRKLEEIKQGFLKGNAYLAEKGKNEATKEDIGELTEKVESIRSQNATAIELLKFDLSKQAQMHRLAAEKEFEALSEIGKALYKLQHDTQRLRPTMDLVDPNESFEERNQKRWKAWAGSHNDFLDAVEKHRLFIPAKLYEQFGEIRHLSYEEALEAEDDFQVGVQSGRERIPLKSYKSAQANIAKLRQTIEDTIRLIQQRYGIFD